MLSEAISFCSLLTSSRLFWITRGVWFRGSFGVGSRHVPSKIMSGTDKKLTDPHEGSPIFQPEHVLFGIYLKDHGT